MLDEKKKQRLCLECMECCKILAVPLAGYCAAALEFYNFRNCSIKRISQGRIGVVIPLPCPHLGPDGCKIYPKRPQACKDYDGTKDPVMRDKCLWIKKNRKPHG